MLINSFDPAIGVIGKGTAVSYLIFTKNKVLCLVCFVVFCYAVSFNSSESANTKYSNSAVAGCKLNWYNKLLDKIRKMVVTARRLGLARICQRHTHSTCVCLSAEDRWIVHRQRTAARTSLRV